MRKLLQIVVEGNTGSTGTMAEMIGQEVLDNGWESYIAYGRYPRPSKSKLIKIGAKWEIFMHGLITRLFDKHGFGSRIATKALIKKIEVIKPDIIQLHHLHGYYINIKVLFNYLAEAKIPVIWTFHDCWAITGHCTHFDYVGCSKWKVECNNCPQIKEYPASLLVDSSKSNFYNKKDLFNSVEDLTIVNVSNWLNKVVAQSFLKSVKSTVIYNGVDINTFLPKYQQQAFKKSIGIGDKFLILGVASPWGERKGLSNFIKLSSFLDEDTVIYLIGVDESQKRQLPKNIIGISKTENKEELCSFYDAADLFINFSVEETFGLVTAEALSCGTPALVYNRTACPEIVDHRTGFVVDYEDYSTVIDSIEKVKVLGKSHFVTPCRERVVRLFSKEKNMRKYYDLYNTIIDKHEH